MFSKTAVALLSGVAVAGSVLLAPTVVAAPTPVAVDTTGLLAGRTVTAIHRQRVPHGDFDRCGAATAGRGPSRLEPALGGVWVVG